MRGDILGLDRPGRAAAHLPPLDDAVANHAVRCHDAHIHDLGRSFKRDLTPLAPFLWAMDGNTVVASERTHPCLGPAIAAARWAFRGAGGGAAGLGGGGG